MSPLPLEQELLSLTKTSPPLIKASKHPNLPLTIYNYTNQAQWKKHWGILTMMCRGLVLEQGTSKIVARPMAKFFNHSEDLHKTPDTDPFTVLQKVDGSLGIWFNYNGEWTMATRGSFTSPQAVEGHRLAVKAGLPTKCDPSQTYCFEIVYPENRLIVNYKDKRELVLLAVIKTDTGYDLPNAELPAVASALGVSMAQQVTPSDASLKALAEINAPNEEGFVIRFDTTGERLKIKFATYLHIAQNGGGGGAGSNYGPTADSVRELVVGLLMKDPHDHIEDHLNAVPDEFYNEIKTTQTTYLKLYEANAATFDVTVARFRETPLNKIDTKLPRHDMVCKYLGMSRRGRCDQAALQQVRNEYAAYMSAWTMDCLPKAKRKRAR